MGSRFKNNELNQSPFIIYLETIIMNYSMKIFRVSVAMSLLIYTLVASAAGVDSSKELADINSETSNTVGSFFNTKGLPEILVKEKRRPGIVNRSMMSTEDALNVNRSIMSMEDALKAYNTACYLIDHNNFSEAERLLLTLTARNQLPQAYMMLVVLSIKEYNTKATKKAAQKTVDYALEAVNKGFLSMNSEVGLGYERLGQYDKAREYYQKALPYAFDDKQVHVNLALLLTQGLGGPEDYRYAVKLYQEAAEANNNDAIYYLALAYSIGRGVAQNVRKAFDIYSQIIKDPKNENYAPACVDVGLMYEWGLIGGKKDLTNAIKYYKMAKDVEDVKARTLLARLIWTDKIPGDKEQAKKELEDCAALGNDHALFLYSAILINQGDIEEGIGILANKYKTPWDHMPSMIRLQLGIAYQDGWGGLQEDNDFAQQCFSDIYTLGDPFYRSTLLSRAYIHIMGLGKDVLAKDRFARMDEGFRLLEESEKKYDDVFLDTYALFPGLKKIKENYYREKDELRRQLIEKEEQEEEQRKAKEKKGKGKAALPSKSEKKSKQKEKASVSPTVVGESSKSAALPQQRRNILDVPIAEWNNFWAQGLDDRSTVLAVNPKKQTITIDDPKRNEKLIVNIEPMPYLNFDDLTELTYDPRVLRRQEEGREQERYNHNFAKMLDYVVQCAGKLGYFAKDASDEPKNQIIANVTRVSNTNNKETRCKAEYTFYQGKNDKKQYLYHRLLRPIGNYAA